MAYGGHLVATPFDGERVTRRWGICTGAGADSATLRDAAQRGLDTLIVGEGPHHTAVEARELGIAVLYAGHYATETLGVRAVGERLATEFGMTSTFIDAPSGSVTSPAAAAESIVLSLTNITKRFGTTHRRRRCLVRRARAARCTPSSGKTAQEKRR